MTPRVFSYVGNRQDYVMRCDTCLASQDSVITYSICQSSTVENGEDPEEELLLRGYLGFFLGSRENKRTKKSTTDSKTILFTDFLGAGITVANAFFLFFTFVSYLVVTPAPGPFITVFSLTHSLSLSL
ncbi:hypothetical protein E2542_SST02972 [Spatholobus suberectus]|nr:hypothetical protein E2542_SST02972 [Spatholobus suberectus]